MTSKRQTLQRYLRNQLISGLFVLVPLWVTYVVVMASFNAMASVLQPLVSRLPMEVPYWVEVMISIMAFIMLVLVTGIIAGRVVGQRFLLWGESLILRIPIIKTIYSAAKQVVDSVSMPNRKTFKSVVVIEYPRPGIKAIGFFTGITTDEAGVKWCRIFIPMSPLPTSGFLHLVPVQEVRITDMTVEEAFKMLISGGVIAPDTLLTRPVDDNHL
ncbi:MAG: DUF502 domain-containing protein [bacterium]